MSRFDEFEIIGPMFFFSPNVFIVLMGQLTRCGKLELTMVVLIAIQCELLNKTYKCI